MEMALTFNDVTLSPISHQNNLWIRAVELAHALGYAQENSVSRIYRSNVTRQIILCTTSCSFGMRKWETLPAYRI